MTPTVSLRKALSDRGLLGNALTGDSWAAWRILMIAAMGEPLTGEERVTFTALTGRVVEPLQRVEELETVVGRRGGKSRAMATLAAYIASLCHHNLATGERGVLLCIAPDQRQAAITLEYAAAALEGSPILRQLIANRTADTLELTNGINIEVRSASFRRLRGPTYIAVIADEAAFWFTDDLSANADTEILNAVRPGLATTTGPLIIASSPYARRGVLWETYRRHFGPDGDPLILVARGTSRDFNPSLPQSVVDRAMERDRAAALAEFGAEFRSDIADFVSREAVLACVELGVRERPPRPGNTYVSFTDPSGGSVDSMTCAIGHTEGDLVVVDCVREIAAPFDPESATDEFANLFKIYGIAKTNGDRYAAAWCSHAFEKRNIEYRHSELAKSALYLNLIPHLNGKTIRLLDDPRSVNQITSLERRTARGGRDSIDHPPQGHDDIANAIAGLAHVAVNHFVPPVAAFGTYGQLPDTRSLRCDVATWSAPCVIPFRNSPPAGDGITTATRWRNTA